MKRALAERAKQSLPQTLKPPQPPTSANVLGDGSPIEHTLSSLSNEAVPSSILSLNDGPPSKVPRVSRPAIKSEDVVNNPDGSVKYHETSKPTLSPPSPHGSKKGLPSVDPIHGSRKNSQDNIQVRKPSRPSIGSKGVLLDTVNSENEDHEGDKASAFYLKHQNSALATELKSLQFAVTKLKEERDARRQHCYECIQSLHSLQATWTALETALQQQQPNAPLSSSCLETPTDDLGLPRIPPSTGTDDSVEWTFALQKALESLGRSSSLRSRDSGSLADGVSLPAKVQRKRKLRQQEDDSSVAIDDDIVDCTTNSVAEMRIAANIASRASVLQEFVLKLLSRSNGVMKDAYVSRVEHERLKALLESQKQTLEIQVAELSAARKETSVRERRIRRNVYRLGAGMLTSDQVVKTIDADEDVASEVELERQQKLKLEELLKENEHLTEVISQNTSENNSNPVCGAVDAENSELPHAQAASLKSKIAELEDQVSVMKNSIADLNELLKKKEERISQLFVRQLSDDTAEKLQLLDSTTAKLKQATDRVEELQQKLLETRTNWAKALGNEKTALSSIDELMGKFNKRWGELTGSGNSDLFSTELSSLDNQEGSHPGSIGKLTQQSKQIIELQHKLDQALENVRQAESTRASLREAMTTNACLQSKLDEIKAKYAMVQASRNSTNSSVPSRPSHVTTESSVISTKEKVNDSSSVTTSREKELNASISTVEKESVGSLSNSKAEKLHRDYRRARKELEKMTASKEATKAKLDRAEKEREILAESNARLLKQIAEKDEVNAKSLSTILYLKSQTDVLMVEKNNFEQQAKTAGQLALAARLATNAKDRISEEIVKEKQALEEHVQLLEKQRHEALCATDRMSLELAEAQGKMVTEKSELSNAMKRINELLAENEKQRERTIQLETAVAKAKRELHEAKSLLHGKKDNDNGNNYCVSISSGGNGGTLQNVKGASFSIEQLNMQISVLKSRLACPVCHERDKQCIIMRCRHMHCQQCVDDQISNRSRKCPTCNNKFSEKDVEDIWLNT